jgi:hypothetical protein
MRVLVKAVRVLLESIRGQVKAMEVLIHYNVQTGRLGFGSGSAWIRINLSCWIRIRIQIADPDPDPGGQK